MSKDNTIRVTQELTEVEWGYDVNQRRVTQELVEVEWDYSVNQRRVTQLLVEVEWVAPAVGGYAFVL